jgi:hypothetical protein
MELKFSMCEAKCCYVHYIKIYASTHPTDTKHNSAFNVVNRLFQRIKEKRYTVYTVQWFYSPELLNHICTYKKIALGTVIPDRKELLEQAVLAKLRTRKKIVYYPFQKKISEVVKDSLFLPSIHLW